MNPPRLRVLRGEGRRRVVDPELLEQLGIEAPAPGAHLRSVPPRGPDRDAIDAIVRQVADKLKGANRE